ncbi:jg23362 [Pararge aegeria aegeria]|uniref:Jg23362 protein n=1 Tax=Pararge aegeria aegeria TaxID=348720 RepID=A0A8S4QV82_9NEOP|nr:jg23362 [Pararge aegeria aegeria]
MPLGDLGGLLSFRSELGWLELTQRGAVPVALRTTEGPGRPSTETSPGKEEEECLKYAYATSICSILPTYT